MQQDNTYSVDSDRLIRLYQFFKPYTWWAVFAIVLTLTAAFLGTVRPKLTQGAVDDYISIGDFNGLRGIIFLLILTRIGEFIVLVMNTDITRWCGPGGLYSQRNAEVEQTEPQHV